MSHTPTPWYALVCDVKGHGSLLNDTGLMIADCAYATEHENEGEVNAAFIVRACNAHEALVAALRDACDFVTPDRWGKGRPAWYDKACTALALAEDK